MTEVLVLDAADVAGVNAALGRALDGGPAVLVQDARARRLAGEGAATDLSSVPDRIALLIQTSGSMGTPKTVALSADALRASSGAVLSRLGGAGQWLLTLPLSYIAGLSVLVRSAASGVEPVVMPSGPFDARTFTEAAEQLTHERRYTSLVPVQLMRLLDEMKHDAHVAHVARRFDAILIGGQALEPSLRHRAEQVGLVVVETYGSSETSGGCVYDGLPLDGVQVRVEESGEVLLSGATLAWGYLGNEELTVDRFVELDGQRWYRTGDGGAYENGSLSISGRLDRIIISGGLKISLDAVAESAAKAVGITQAVAINIPDSEWGERPGVVVTVDASILAGSSASESGDADNPPSAYAAVYDAIVAELGRAAAPKAVEVVEHIPLLESGKPNLVALRDLCLARLES